MNVQAQADGPGADEPALVGREAELAVACTRLLQPDVRVLVLRGPGGVGKTTLARVVAQQLGTHFDAGAVFVELAPLRGPGQLLPAVSQALGVRDGPSPLAALEQALGDRTLLLVLDNLEHLPEPEGDVAALCTRLTGMRLLVTSRRVLRVRHAHELPLPPLVVPGQPQEAARSPAVQLFVQRAQAVDPAFTLTPDNAPLVTAVCAALGGLPLALELAAARLRVVDLAGLLDWLGTPLEVLDGGPLDDAPRSRSMRDAVRWSSDLLTREEHAVFTACGIFRGGFTLDALKAVTGRSDVLTTLITLVDHSLIRRAEGAPPRWTVLEPVREFAAEELRRSPWGAAVVERHTRFYLHVARETDEAEMRPAPERMARLTADEPNLLASLDRLIASGRADDAQALAHGLVSFWFARGQPTLAVRHLQRVLELPGGRSRLRLANLYANAAGLASRAGDHEQAERWARAALALYRDLGDAAGAAGALSNLADMLAVQGRSAEAVTLFLAALESLETLGDVWNLGATSHNLAATLSQTGQYEASLPHFERAMELWRQLDHVHGIMYTSGVRAVQHLRRSHLPEGRADARRAWHLGREAQDVIFREALLFIGGLLAARLGHKRLGVRLTAASDALRTRADVHLAVSCERERAELIAELRAELPSGDLDAAWEAGTLATPDEVAADLDAAMTLEPAAPHWAPTTLTPRELEVLASVARGHSDKKIALALGISAATVSKHVTSMLHKLELHNRVELARWAVERRLPP